MPLPKKDVILDTIHRYGWLADLVYTQATKLRPYWWRYRNWQAQKYPVAMHDALDRRADKAMQSLSTGVTNICNAKCTFCAYPQVAGKTMKQGVMTFDIFKRAVDEFAAQGGTTLDLTPVVGDPLIDPGLLDKIEYATKLGIKNIVLTTNGILLEHENLYSELVHSGLTEVFISTSGLDPAAYESAYGTPKFLEMLRGVISLIECNHKSGEPLKIAIRFRNPDKPSVTINSAAFKEHIKPYLSSRVSVSFTLDFDNWGGTVTEKNMVGQMKLRPLPPTINIPCQSLFGRVVRHDGKVRACGCRLVKTDDDDLVIGQLKPGVTLASLATGERSEEIIRGFYTGHRPSTCINCSQYIPINQQWLAAK